MRTNSQVTDSSVSDSQAQSSMRTIGVQTNLSGKGQFWQTHCSIDLIYHLSAVCPVLQEKSVPTLRLLQRELYKVADKWEDIGIQLDIDVDMLEKVKLENQEDSKKCLREMLKIFIKKEDVQPSWRDIVDTLAMDCLEEKELAKQLRDKYC